jgi:hypothetical protein
VPSHARTAGVRIAVFVLCCAAAPVAHAQSAPEFSRDEVASAVATVKRDPNFGGERKMTLLRWRDKAPRSKRDLSWLAWTTGFFGWTMQSARSLVWVGLALLAGWLAVYLTRVLRARGSAPESADTFQPPTHVRDLDIRPASLPANIGEAARAMWERGDHRAALSLLYRGLLSRLSHVHRVPIVDSSTEGDCLTLLGDRVPPPTREYAARLVDAWRGFVYGGTEAATPAVHALCDGFAAALDRSVVKPMEGNRS